MSETLVKRSDKVSFLNTGTSDVPVYTRMTKFTEIAKSKNASEYTRQYVDEESETTDVTGYSEEVRYGFDQHTNNAVHEIIVNVTDNELTGDNAVIEVVTVDKSKQNTDGSYEARYRKYAVIPDGEGDSTDAYTYSGKLKVKGKFTKGTATLNEDETVATFTEDTEDDTEDDDEDSDTSNDTESSS